MRERAELLGGTLTAGPTDGGFRVELLGAGVTDTIRVLLADDQRVVREGLGMLLGLLAGIEVVGTAADGEEAVALAVELHPDVVLMDLRMPRCDGVEATRRLREHDPSIKVLVLTTYADDRSVIDALRAGARGYLTKDAGADEIRERRRSRSPAGRPPSTRPCSTTCRRRHRERARAATPSPSRSFPTV